MNILICDDEGSIVETIKRHTTDYMRSQNVKYNIDTYNSAENVLSNYRLKPDLCLLDIEMPGMNGIDLAVRLLEINSNVIFIFVTNHYNYINSVIRHVSIGGYLHKSKIDREFTDVMNYSINKVMEKNQIINIIEYDDVVHGLKVNDIMAVYIRNGIVRVRTTKTEYMVKNKFNDIKKLLEMFDFNMAAAKILVNNEYISLIDNKTCTIAADGKNEITVPLSKRYYIKFMDSYKKYLFKDKND